MHSHALKVDLMFPCSVRIYGISEGLQYRGAGRVSLFRWAHLDTALVLNADPRSISYPFHQS